MTTYIYILKCPVSGDVRYVGKTINLKKRFNCHYSPANKKTKTYLWSWVKGLRNKGMKPIMEVIEECGGNWAERERYWISFYKTNGAKLCNLTNGGEGILGNKRSEETRLKISKNNAKTKLIVRPVFQYDYKGNLLAEYHNPTEAATKSGVKRYKILRSCNGYYIRGGGFIWSFVNVPKVYVSPKKKIA